MRIHIEPKFRGVDEGDGGIRRVVEAQHRYLPDHGIEVIDDMVSADLVATHAGAAQSVPVHKPWVVHTHGLYWQGYEWPRWCHDLNRQVIDAMKHADHVTAPSEWVSYALARGMWIKPSVLYHGVDPEEWKPGRNGSYVFWNKTRIDPVCDPRPVMTLAQRLPNLRFITTFGSQAPNVEVTGRLPYEEGKELGIGAAVYLCTTRETFGIGTLEAMAAGVPVVGWAWGGQTEIIKHGVTGWLARPNDYDGLVEGIEWALQNRQEIGEKARADVLERWTWEQAIARYAKLYHELYAAAAELYTGPRVSVVIPSHNLGRYLYDNIESLKAQTMENWEAVIVDDASTDDSLAHAEAQRVANPDRNIKVISNPKNLYLAGTLNKGIAASSGRYILPLDADNRLGPDALQELTTALDQDRSIDIAYGKCQFVLEDGHAPDTNVAPDGISSWPTEFAYPNQIRARNQVPSTAMYRRRVPFRIGGYRRRWRTSEDADFWTRATSFGFNAKMVTGAITLIYRQRADSMSRKHAIPNYAAWYPWSTDLHAMPFGVAADPPQSVNTSLAWHVPTFENPRVAIIIPVGPGHEELLIDALDSVQAQQFRQWECIVINDTGRELPWVPPWARVLDTGGGAGPARCRNEGLRASRAPFFIPLDADDYLQPNAVQELVDNWAQFRGVVYSQWYDEFATESKIYDPPEYDARHLIDKGMIFAVTALYERAAWEKVGGFDEELTHWEDWDFHLRLARAGICGTKIPKPLWSYRKHTGFRREDNINAFEQGKAAILGKWQSVWDGREELMACRGCPGGGGGRYQAQAGPGGKAVGGPTVNEGWVLIQFIGPGQGTRTYKGKSTNTVYRFGGNPSHRRKYVYEDDAVELLQILDGRNPIFEKIAEPTKDAEEPERLEALGPPEGFNPSNAATNGAALNQGTPGPGVAQHVVEQVVEKGFADVEVIRDQHDEVIGIQPVVTGEAQLISEGESGLEVVPATPEAPVMATMSEETPKSGPIHEDNAPVHLSTRQLKAAVDEMSEEALHVRLAQEKAGQNRSTAIAILEAELKSRHDWKN